MVSANSPAQQQKRGAAVRDESRQQANAEHKTAKQHLEQVSRRDGEETEDYLAANQQVAQTEKRVSFWRR